MDKNMINIDDLFRQRLGNGEEEDRAAAWMNMRDLLDKKMPAGMVNWRRIFTYASGLLLLAAIGIGGYEVSSSTRHIGNADILAASDRNTDKPSAIATNAATATMPVNDNKHAVPAYSSSNNINATSTSKQTTATAANSGTAYTGSQKSSATDNAIANNDHLKQSTSKASNTPNTSTTGKPANDKNDTKQSNDPNRNEKVFAAATTAAGANKESKQNKSALGTIAKTSPLATTAGPKKESAFTGNMDGAKKQERSSGKNNDAGRIIPSSGNSAPVAKAMDGNGKNAGMTRDAKRVKDSIDKLEVRLTMQLDPITHQYITKIDTVDMSKMARYTNEPEMTIAASQRQFDELSQVSRGLSAKNSSQMKDIKPAASIGLASSGAMGKIDANNTAAKKRKQSNWDWSALSERLRDFEYELGKVKVYPGLIGGINKTFGTSSNAGFQLGFTTEFVLNDRMSLMGELKYMQRFNGGSIQNTYTTNSTPFYNGFDYEVTTTTYKHSYNYSTLNSMELPISIRYAIGNFYVYAGGNLVYTFAINVSDNYPEMISQTTERYPHNPNLPAESNKIAVSDFGSRFGLGYLFGTSYEFTRSIMVDARFTQTVWDNAPTAGAKQISDLLLKGPSLQLSIIYRLNHQRPETVTPRY